MALSVSDIRSLFEQYGGIAYSGEPVTQLQHALQSGVLAEEAGANDELVAAAFLHDLGHLLNLQGATPTERGIDDLHQYFALPFLRAVLPDAVLEPIRLHVDAKRCLCAIDDAIRISNSTAYGLSSAVCTNRLDYITRFVSELQVGTVNVREVPGYRLELTPFGGIKDSGLGYKEGVQEAMKSFTNVKTYSIPFG